MRCSKDRVFAQWAGTPLASSYARMSGSQRRKLTQHLSDARILIQHSTIPLVKMLLLLAETVVESGVVKDPLEYYKELANQSSPWIALPDQTAVPTVKIFHICSSGVRRLTAALALCSEGIRVERGNAIQIVVLISVPSSSVSSYLSLLAQVVRLLEPTMHREALLGSNGPAEVWSLLSHLESEPAQAAHP